MKTKQFFALLALIVLTNACGNVKEAHIPPALTSAVTAVSASLDSLSNSLNAAATGLAQVGADTAMVRSELQRFYNECSFGSEFVFTTPEGILQLVEPAVYYPSQGSDISQQAHIIKAFETKLPALSDVFSVVEGFQAVVQPSHHGRRPVTWGSKRFVLTCLPDSQKRCAHYWRRTFRNLGHGKNRGGAL
jgi:hypothetical protein